MKRTTMQAIAVLAGVFALGVLTGSAATLSLGGPAAFHSRPHHGGRMQMLEQRLDLTDEQSRRIEAIFSARSTEMEQLKREMFEGCGQPLREKVAAIDAEIRTLLDPEQQRAFDELVEERRQRGLRGPFGPHHRGHGPPGLGRGPGGPPRP